jgi:hypothetical protein
MGLSSQCVIKRELGTSAALGSHKLARRFVATLTDWKPKSDETHQDFKMPATPSDGKSFAGGRFDFSESDCRSARHYFFGNHPALTDSPACHPE